VPVFLCSHAVGWRLRLPASAGAITAASMSFVGPEGSSNNLTARSNISAAVGLSGCLWPFLINEIDGEGLGSDFVPPPYFDVHGDRDERVYPFLATMTFNYLAGQRLHVAPARNRLSVVEGGEHVPWSVAVAAVQRPLILRFLVESMRLQNHQSCPPL
jgi:hypothetical protein